MAHLYPDDYSSTNNGQNGYRGKDGQWVHDYSQKYMCPECREDPPYIVEEYSNGDVLCGSCGLVLMEHIVDFRSEWRTFSGDNEDERHDPRRCGDEEDTLLTGSAYHTFIGDGEDNSFALGKAQAAMTRNATDEQLKKAYSSIDAFCAGVLTKDVVDCAKQLFKISFVRKIVRSGEDLAAVGLCIFYGCRQRKVDRTLREISRLTGQETPDLKKALGKYSKAFGSIFAEIEEIRVREERVQQPTDEARFYENVGPSSTKVLMARYCQQLGLPNWSRQPGRELAEAIEDTLVLGARGAPTVGGTVVYVLSCLIGEEKPLAEVSNVCDMSQGTLRTAIGLLAANRDEVLRNTRFPKHPGIKPERFPMPKKPSEPRQMKRKAEPGPSLSDSIPSKRLKGENMESSQKKRKAEPGTAPSSSDNPSKKLKGDGTKPEPLQIKSKAEPSTAPSSPDSIPSKKLEGDGMKPKK